MKWEPNYIRRNYAKIKMEYKNFSKPISNYEKDSNSRLQIAPDSIYSGKRKEGKARNKWMHIKMNPNFNKNLKQYNIIRNHVH